MFEIDLRIILFRLEQSNQCSLINNLYILIKFYLILFDVVNLGTTNY